MRFLFIKKTGGISFVPLLFMVVFLATPVEALKGEWLRTEMVTIIYPKPLAPAAREIAVIYPGIKSELEDALVLPVDFQPTVVIIRDHEKFQQIVGQRRFVAFAVPDKQLIFIDYSRMHISPFTLRTTLKHELCHLLLHRHIDSERLPKWLDEGIAQWVCKGISELMVDPKKSVLDRAAITGHYLSLRAISRSFPSTGDALQLAYEESQSVVTYLIDEYGLDGMLCVIKRLREGQDIDIAFETCLAISLPAFEARWHRDIGSNIQVLAFLSAHLYEFLFFAAALMTILGFIRMLWKRKRIRDDGEYGDDIENDY
jgi:hypothetical protein